MIKHQEMIRYLNYYKCHSITYQKGGVNKIRNLTKNYVDAFIYKKRQNIPLQ